MIKHQTKQSAGADLSANETVTLNPSEVKLVGTGFNLNQLSEKQQEYLKAFNAVFMLCNRSSVAFKKRLIVMNGVGVIDQDYKDEVKVMFMNLGDKPVVIEKGERIAQLVPMQYISGVFEVKDNERKNGFGSTGS